MYANVNGINLYYERHGSGRPMILLHGGLGSGEMFGPILPQLSDHHEIILPDLQGHGRTADIDRPIDHRLMADDIAALIDHLGLDKPDLVGYSLGGGVAFFTALKYPDKVSKLVLISTNVTRNAIPAEMLALQAQVSGAAVEFMKDTPMYQNYVRVAPRPEDFGKLLDKIGAMMAPDFDYSEELRSLKVPTMIVAADADMAPPSHYVEVFKLLDGGLRDGGWMGEGRPKGGHALAILPRLTHYNMAESPVVATAILDFLDS
ncbi:MAG: alpha/beta hydrolase [Chloroflexota bacterium]